MIGTYFKMVFRCLPRKLKLSFICSFDAKGKQNASIDVEDLNPVIVWIANDDTICVGHRYVMRMFQLTGFVPVRTKFPDESSIRLKYLYIFVCSNTDWMFLLHFGPTHPVPCGTHLNSMIFLVAYVDET